MSKKKDSVEKKIKRHTVGKKRKIIKGLYGSRTERQEDHTEGI